MVYPLDHGAIISLSNWVLNCNIDKCESLRKKRSTWHSCKQLFFQILTLTCQFKVYPQTCWSFQIRIIFIVSHALWVSGVTVSRRGCRVGVSQGAEETHHVWPCNSKICAFFSAEAKVRRCIFQKLNKNASKRGRLLRFF